MKATNESSAIFAQAKRICYNSIAWVIEGDYGKYNIIYKVAYAALMLNVVRYNLRREVFHEAFDEAYIYSSGVLDLTTSYYRLYATCTKVVRGLIVPCIVLHLIVSGARAIKWHFEDTSNQHALPNFLPPLKDISRKIFVGIVAGTAMFALMRLTYFYATQVFACSLPAAPLAMVTPFCARSDWGGAIWSLLECSAIPLVKEYLLRDFLDQMYEVKASDSLFSACTKRLSYHSIVIVLAFVGLT